MTDVGSPRSWLAAHAAVITRHYSRGWREAVAVEANTEAVQP